MKKLTTSILGAIFAMFFMVSCDNNEAINPSDEVSVELKDILDSNGFDGQGAFINGDGKIMVEGDIVMTEDQIRGLQPAGTIPNQEHYSTNNLVSSNGSRNISIYAPTGRRGYSAAMLAGLDEAIARYNNENLTITFSRASSANSADIVMTRLRRRDERRGVLGSAGFPTNGNPYGEIKMSGVLESSYGLSTNGIATIIAHEMGHCIGFRHTDFFDRSISCGGSTANEGDGGVGANHIPGTPTGATLSKKSFMLACADGGDRPFNNDDKTALDYLY